MEKNQQIQIFEARVERKISQLARKYSGELVFKIWEEMKTAGEDRIYFSLCGWKPEMTLMEALECLDDYCDFIDAMIRKYQQKGNEKRGCCYPPLFFQ